jgi:hypothetical protein
MSSSPRITCAGTQARPPETFWAWVALIAGGLLLFGLPITHNFRTPGGLSGDWYLFAALDGVYTLLCATALWFARRGGATARIVLYFTFAIGVGAAADLAISAQEQRRYDYWAHRGISNFGGMAR